MSAVHVAIVDRVAARHLLAGRKQIETRFSRQRRSPFGRIGAGDTVHFKLVGGRFIGTAGVVRVRQFEDLTPSGVSDLCRRYKDAVCAPGRYWRRCQRCRYGLLIWIRPLGPPPPGLWLARQYGTGWVVLGVG